MRQFVKLFKKVGGKEILRQYAQAHVLIYSMLITLLLGFSKKSLEIVRLAINNKILNKLRKKNRMFIQEYVNSHQENLPRIHARKIWILWLQGLDQAPELVQQCYFSVKKNITDYDVVLLTEDNYRNYVTFPDYIQEKIDLGIITKTHMSDLLRLELLNRYGGTWIDATVFCSGGDIPDYMLNSDLFLFQSLKPGLDGQCTCISSWFMTSCSNHPILLLTQALLYEYWKSATKMVDYFLLHDFFQLSIEVYQNEWKKVIPFCNSAPHILLLRLFEDYNPQVWEAVTKITPFHKMTYKFQTEQTHLSGTYYDKIFKLS